MKNQDILIHPELYTYALRMVQAGRKKKDGTKYPKGGPYWYANLMEDGRLRTFYIGRVLPEECKPYAPTSTYMDHPNPTGRGLPPKRMRGASDSILEALDNGEQVVLDIDKIAKDCDAYVDMIAHRRYVFYRDPPTNE